MRKKILTALVPILFLIATFSNAQATPVWPLNVGEVWVLYGQDNVGNDWYEYNTILGTATYGLHEYFHIDSYNYHNEGTHRDLYFRSTDTEVFMYAGGGIEDLFFQIADIGTVWNYNSGDTQTTIYDITDVTIPYNGGTTLEAYVLERHGTTTPTPSWFEYFVPGFGYVAEVDFYLPPEENPPIITTLVDIKAPVPEPSTMLLLGVGLIGLAGATRRKLKK